jgi:HlyD family secretion protein
MMAVRILVAVAVALGLSGCNGPKPATYQGWIEADLIFVAPDEVGRVETLSVREGMHVEAGAPLFTVDADLQKADLAVAEASATNARQAHERAKTLLKSAAGTQKAYEDAEMALRSADARVASARTRLVRRQVFSPVTGSVQQIYFRPGEVVPASRPVVSLLPPGNLKVRFFVPEAVLPKIALGDPVTIRCDGCPEHIPALITFISRASEFTPPVIYSQEERSKLVFLVEARTDRTDSLRVGQPVSVVLAGKEAKTEAKEEEKK